MHLRLRLSGSGSQESPLRQPSVAKSCDYQRHHQQASGGFLPIGCIFSNKRTAPTNQSNAKVLRLRKSRPVWLTMFYCMLKGFWVRHYEPEILSVGSCSWLLIHISDRVVGDLRTHRDQSLCVACSEDLVQSPGGFRYETSQKYEFLSRTMVLWPTCDHD